MEYGLKEYKELLEKAYNNYNDPMSVPFGMNPYSYEANAYRLAKQEALNWAIEMLPEIVE